jgi:hypothetical protein
MKVTYNKQLTALLVIDPYNDLFSLNRKEFSHAPRPH